MPWMRQDSASGNSTRQKAPPVPNGNRLASPRKLTCAGIIVDLGFPNAWATRYAYAQQHLEAWYFGDTANLRAFGAPGHIDTSKPDESENPKGHLKNVLDDRVYTARISEEIAMSLDPKTIAGRSPSFRGFLEAVKNGVSSRDADGP